VVPDGLVHALLRRVEAAGPLGQALAHDARTQWLIRLTRDARAHLPAAPLAPPPPALPPADAELAALMGDPRAWEHTLPAGSDARLLTAAVVEEVEGALSAADRVSLQALRAAGGDEGRARAARLRAQIGERRRAERAALAALEAAVGHPFGPDPEAAAEEAERRVRIFWAAIAVPTLRGAPALFGQRALPLVAGGGGGMNATATDYAAATERLGLSARSFDLARGAVRLQRRAPLMARGGLDVLLEHGLHARVTCDAESAACRLEPLSLRPGAAREAGAPRSAGSSSTPEQWQEVVKTDLTPNTDLHKPISMCMWHRLAT
jgi:hypothetical protein